MNKSVLSLMLGLGILISSLPNGGGASVGLANSPLAASGAVAMAAAKDSRQTEKEVQLTTSSDEVLLSFVFGSSDAADGFTQVTDTLYTETLGYGFARTDKLTVNSDNVTGMVAFRFKADVPNGNYTVKVDTTAELMTSESVESVTAKTGIEKTGDTFSVAVCDGVLDLTFPPSASVKTIEISKEPVKDRQEKPFVYAIGDSTTKNNADGALSWGNCVEGGKVIVPDIFGGFANHGMAGRNSVNYYNQGRVEAVLLAICPGDYVTVNMGINSEDGEKDAYYTLISSYYVEGILQRGGIPVIVTATPDGPVGGRLKTNYDEAAGKFTNSRGNGVRNNTLRQIAEEKDLALIELGQWAQDWMNTLTDEDVAEYNAANDTEYATVLEMVQSWYIDHNHYKEYLGIQIGNYLFEELTKLAEAEPEPGSDGQLAGASTEQPIGASTEQTTGTSTEQPIGASTEQPVGASAEQSSRALAEQSERAAATPWIIIGVLAVIFVGVAAVIILQQKKEKEKE